MIEILTQSGATIRSDASTEEQKARLRVAARALGGEILRSQMMFTTDAVLEVTEGGVLGTKLTDSSNQTYELWPSGWVLNGEPVLEPPFGAITKIAVPGASEMTA